MAEGEKALVEESRRRHRRCADQGGRVGFACRPICQTSGNTNWLLPMAYELNQFIADCRAILTRSGPARPRGCAPALERLLANKEFVAATCGDDVPTGLQGAVRGQGARLPGARAHQRQGAQVAAARSRRLVGDLRAGDAIHRNDRMGAHRRRRQARRAEGDQRYRLNPGEAGIYQDGATTRSTIPTARASSA